MKTEKYHIGKARKSGGNIVLTISRDLNPKQGEFFIVKRIENKINQEEAEEAKNETARGATMIKKLNENEMKNGDREKI